MQMYTLKVLQVGLGATALAAVLIASIAANDAHATGMAPPGPQAQPSIGTFRALNNVGVISTQPGLPAQRSMTATPADAPRIPPPPNGSGGSRAGHGGLPGMGN